MPGLIVLVAIDFSAGGCSAHGATKPFSQTAVELLALKRDVQCKLGPVTILSTALVVSRLVLI